MPYRENSNIYYTSPESERRGRDSEININIYIDTKKQKEERNVFIKVLFELIKKLLNV